MKLRLLFALAAVSCVAAGAASSATPLLSGSFRTTITGKNPAALNATWVLKITQFGQMTINRNGKLAVKGVAAGARGKLAITDNSGPYACKGIQVSAVYTYTLSGNKLTLKPKVELCAGRKTVLTTRPLTKIG